LNNENGLETHLTQINWLFLLMMKSLAEHGMTYSAEKRVSYYWFAEFRNGEMLISSLTLSVMYL